ncbi:MAG TPA: fused MFS/spermidine synthase [Thermoanaerobaculia bacterium]|nr:fused MFS/spermidine synthase [Thermoanaerobaculia bacterium]
MIRLYTVVFLSGAALMGLEIAGSRVMAPVFGTSIFVWGSLITTFLASLAAGYALGGRLADRRPRASLLGGILVGAGLLVWLPLARPAPLLALCAAAPVPDRFQALLAALLLFALPSVLMGAVSPFAMRLAAREVGTIGRTAGSLAALSTAGSIVGTFSMTFLFIPAFPIEPILFGIGATLVLCGAFASRDGLPGRLGFAAAGLAAAAAVFLVRPERVPSPVPDGTVVFRKETAYHRLLVVDQGPRRVLFFNNLAQGFVSRSSGMATGRVYSDGLAASLLFRRAPARNAFVIGLGTGMLPRLLSERAPEIATTSVEIDPEVVRVAGEYFGFRPDANDRVLVGDGRTVLERERGPWDAIILDAYFSDSLPFHLTTREFLELCRERLSPDGVFSANFVGTLMGKEQRLFWSFVRTAREVFPTVAILSAELSSGKPVFQSNAILVASPSRDRLSKERVVAEGDRLAAALHHPPIAEWAREYHEGELRTDEVPVLTDSFSPTDALQHLGR